MAEMEIPRTHEEEEVFEALEELDISTMSQVVTQEIEIKTQKTELKTPVKFTKAVGNVTQSPYATPKRHDGKISRRNNQLMIKPKQLQLEANTHAVISPFTTYRLKPISERVKQTRLSITPSGSVNVELFKPRHNVDSLVESFEVSQDGIKITVTQYKQPPQTHNANDITFDNVKRKVFSLDKLPQKLHRKYEFARRFVNLVKSKTPKIIIYSKQAKCMLMENFPDPCFMAKCYNGQTYLSTWRGTQLVNEELGSILSVTSPRSEQQFSDDTQTLIKFAERCHKQCLQLEGLIRSTVEDSSQNEDIFPVVLGRRRTTTERNERTANETFIVPDTLDTSNTSAVSDHQDISIIDNITRSRVGNSENDVIDNINLDDGTGSYVLDTGSKFLDNGSDVLDNRLTEEEESDIVFQTRIPDIGVATELPSGGVWVEFDDGCHLGLNPVEDMFAFVDKNGVCHEHDLSGDLPDDVKTKLVLVPEVLDYLYSKNDNSTSTRRPSQ